MPNISLSSPKLKFVLTLLLCLSGIRELKCDQLELKPKPLVTKLKSILTEDAFLNLDRNIAPESNIMPSNEAIKLDFTTVLKTRSKRDMQEISQNGKVMFAPEVIHRTRMALLRQDELLRDIGTFIKNYRNESTTDPPLVESTTPPPSSNITTEAPGSSITPPSTNATTNSSSGGETTPVPPTGNVTESKGGVEGEAETDNQRVERLILFRSRRQVAGSNTTTNNSSFFYTSKEILNAVKNVFNSSEIAMTNQLSAFTVTLHETRVLEMDRINASMATADLTGGTKVLLQWIKYTLLSSKHALNKFENEHLVHELVGQADKILSLITAAFCFLALILTLFLCFLSYRSRKSSYADYDLERERQARNIPNRNPSSISSDTHSQQGTYSSPSRAAANVRSNPMYSSHRSVDVERPTMENNINEEDDRADNRSSDPVTAKNERNVSFAKARGSPPRSRRRDDYKDPRRHRNNVDGRDNEGYRGDEIIGVKSDSESVL